MTGKPLFLMIPFLRSTSEGFVLEKEYKNIKYNKGTIIIKDNRLVSANSVTKDDAAYIIASRGYEDGEYYAGIVAINDRFNPDFIDIYRGRIASIERNTSVTVESFSRFDGLNWEFFNTPKTFLITYDTKIVDDTGIIGQRNFLDFGESSFKDKDCLYTGRRYRCSTYNYCTYGNVNVKGEIYQIVADRTVNEEGEELGVQQVHGFTLIDAKEYNPSTFMWEDTKDRIININILK